MQRKRKAALGSSLEEFLREEGLLEEAQAVAEKRILAWQLEAERKKRKLTKAALAKRMNTSRAQLDRLLDPDNANQSFGELARLAHALGKRLHVKLVEA
jgi:DNA-binding phage protein